MSEAYLMWGVPLRNILKQEVKSETVTRYDEKTGKPYQREERTTAWTLCGKQVRQPEEDPREYPEELLDDYRLDAAANGLEGHQRDFICGVEVARCSDCNSGGQNIVAVGAEEIDAALLEAKERLGAIGYEGTPALFLVMRESF